MTDLVGSWTGAPTGWAGSAPDDADPTGGRHVLDRDAALTPIFTTLRRGAWRRSRPQSAGRPLRPVPDPVAQFRSDPHTAPIPVVTVDPYAPASFAPAAGPRPPVSPSAPISAPTSAPVSGDATTWWEPPIAAGRGGPPVHHPAPVHPAHDRWTPGPAAYGSGPYGPIEQDAGYAPAPHGSGSYEAAYQPAYHPAYEATYDPAAYDPAPHDPAAHDPVGYEPVGSEPHRYEPAPVHPLYPLHDATSYDATSYGSGPYRRHEPAAYDPAPYEPAPYEPGPYGPGVRDAVPYQPATYEPVPYGPPVHHLPRRDHRFHGYGRVSDTGRHHHRLAPAGW